METKIGNRIRVNPIINIIKNEKVNQVALINPLENTWIKISLSVFELIKQLEDHTILDLNQNNQIQNNEVEQLFNLVKHLLSKQYLVKNNEYSKLKKINADKEYRKNTKGVISKLPKRIWLSITDACNLKCIYCYNTVKKPLEEDYQTSEILYKVLKKLKGENIYEIILTGGEPFLRNDIIRIISECLEYTERITITTNGLLIDTDSIKKIKEFGEKITISVSLDGLTKDTHERLRGKNTFNKTISIINKLKNEGIKTHIVATITKLNYKELVEFDDFIKKYHVSGNLSFYTPVGFGKDLEDKLIMDKSAIADYKNLLLIKNSKLPINETVNKKMSGLSTGFNCSAGIGVLGIEHTGRVVPCHLFLGKDIELGNLLHEELESMQLKWIDKITTVNENKECSICKIKYFCGNGCIANNYYNTGRFNGKNPNCIIQKTGINHKLWLLEN